MMKKRAVVVKLLTGLCFVYGFLTNQIETEEEEPEEAEGAEICVHDEERGR